MYIYVGYYKCVKQQVIDRRANRGGKDYKNEVNEKYSVVPYLLIKVYKFKVQLLDN
jgi:hypothetical protein